MSRATRRPSAGRSRGGVRRTVALVVTMLGVLMLGAPLPRAADASTAIASGRQLYMAVGCWQCHGTVGQGGSAGPRLAPGPMPLDALRAFLRHSVRAMPAYPATILSDAGIADIHAYLKSLPAAPRAETLPLLRDLR